MAALPAPPKPGTQTEQRQPQTCSPLHASCTASPAKHSAPRGPDGNAHPGSLRLSGLERPRQARRPGGRGRPGLAQALFPFLRPAPRRRAALPEARSWHGSPTRPPGPRAGAVAAPPGSLRFPSRGSRRLRPPPPSARRHFVRSRCDTDTIVGPNLPGKAQAPRALGSRLPAPDSPPGSGPTYANHTNSRIPFAPHS